MPTSTTKSQSTTPNSGIQTTATGDRHIPQSVRADGSVRKEIKIRPGYRPPEDVEVYKNRTAEAWKTRGQGGIPGSAIAQEDDADRQADGKGSAAGKNAKRREARKRAKAVEAGAEAERDTDKSDIQDATEVNGAPTSQAPASKQGAAATTSTDPEAEREKQARNLKKKLRQARELKEKKDSGGDLLPEQFAKVIKIQELIRQLDALGFEEDKEEGLKDG